MAETTTYIIENSDGDRYTVNENSTNTETSIALIGHGMPDYGQDQNTNFLHMLEHFAYKEEPRNPIIGQLWFKKFDSGRYELRVCKKPTALTLDERWDRLTHVLESVNTSETYATGDVWYDAENSKLKIYDSVLGDWNTIGPTNVIHTEHVFNSIVLNRTQYNRTTYTDFDMSVFKQNIDDTTQYMPGVTSNGSLNMCTMTIVAKEFINNGISSNIRCCTWVYKFSIRSRNLADGRKIELIGAPSYELIGKTDNTDWEIDITMENTGSGDQLLISFKDNGSSLGSDDYISIGMDTEIVRV